MLLLYNHDTWTGLADGGLVIILEDGLLESILDPGLD